MVWAPNFQSPRETQWRHIATYSSVNIGSGNCLNRYSILINFVNPRLPNRLCYCHCLNYHLALKFTMGFCVFFLTKTVDNIKAWPMIGMFSVLLALCQENPSIIGSFSS